MIATMLITALLMASDYGAASGTAGATVVAILIIFGCIVPVVIAYSIGSKKGKGGVGFALGFFLGWIGVIIIAIMADDRQREMEHKEMLAAVSGGGGRTTVKVKCPTCGVLVDEGAKFCPGCGAQI